MPTGVYDWRVVRQLHQVVAPSMAHVRSPVGECPAQPFLSLLHGRLERFEDEPSRVVESRRHYLQLFLITVLLLRVFCVVDLFICAAYIDRFRGPS